MPKPKIFTLTCIAPEYHSVIEDVFDSETMLQLEAKAMHVPISPFKAERDHLMSALVREINKLYGQIRCNLQNPAIYLFGYIQLVALYDGLKSIKSINGKDLYTVIFVPEEFIADLQANINSYFSDSQLRYLHVKPIKYADFVYGRKYKNIAKYVYASHGSYNKLLRKVVVRGSMEQKSFSLYDLFIHDAVVDFNKLASHERLYVYNKYMLAYNMEK